MRTVAEDFTYDNSFISQVSIKVKDDFSNSSVSSSPSKQKQKKIEKNELLPKYFEHIILEKDIMELKKIKLVNYYTGDTKIVFPSFTIDKEMDEAEVEFNQMRIERNKRNE